MAQKGKEFMKAALELAQKGNGYVNPNPLVGAVIVRDGSIVGRGYHRKFGAPHAEMEALTRAGDRAEGAEMYVTLEPCVHRGKTPPCTPAITEAGIERVYISTVDSNPQVNGRGVEALKQAGIEVNVGLLEEETRTLNEIYFHYVQKNTPFVLIKLASTVDGKIATKTGDSHWISCDESRKTVHRLRARYSAVAVGINTVLTDDPMLTAREVEGPTGARVVIDSGGRIPLNARLFDCECQEPVIVATTERIAPHKEKALSAQDAKVWKLPSASRGVDLSALLERLGANGYDSLLVEGGGELSWGFVSGSRVQKFVFFIAPTIIGGKEAVPVVGGSGFSTVEGSLKLKDVDLERSGRDVKFSAYPSKGSKEKE